MPTKLVPNIVYKTVNGLDVHLDLLLPDPLPSTPAPLIVEIHGGGWLQGEKDGMRGAPYVERGFITASLDYRLLPTWINPAQIDDCRDAIRWLRSHADQYAIDPNRTGVTGGSAGGHLCALLGTSGEAIDREQGGVSCRVQAVVDMCGPADITVDDCIPFEASEIYLQFFGGPIADNLEAARDASAISFVGPDMPPFLIFHCADDPTVPVRHSESLGDALKAAGADVTTVIYPTGGHGFEGRWEIVNAATMDFFVSRLL